MRRLISPILLYGLALVLVFSVSVLAAPSSSSPGIISVTGSASISAKPDFAQIIMGVDTEASTAKSAQESNNASMSKVVKALSDIVDHDSLKTLRASVMPVYEYDKASGSNRVKGYKAENRVLVSTSDLSDVGKLVDSAIKAGANVMESISYTLKNTESVRRQALKEATANAKERAKTLAEALGVDIVGLKAASDSGSNPVPLMRTAFEADMMSKRSIQIPVEEGQVEVTVQVSLEYLAQ